MPSPKRPSDEPHGADFVNKAPRLDPGIDNSPDDYAGSLRRKTVASSRTGQACDRCKVRKIRCDARLGGCSPCLQNQTECKTTDRITGRATSRGHTENLENENASLRLHVVELENQLKEKSILPAPRPNLMQAYVNSTSTSFSSFAPSSSIFSPDTSQDAQNAPEASRSLPEFRSARMGENYLGASSINQFMSPITGTSLRLWNKTIDLIDYILPETSPEAQARSYAAFLSHAFDKSSPPIDAPSLPQYADFKDTADTYFKFLAAFAPVLHRPDFMRLLTRVYNDGHQPTAAEKVMLHMVLAVVEFQIGARNHVEGSRKRAIEHYHYSLGFIPALIESHELEDIQALVMICAQLRSHQRPGAAWMFTNMVLGIVIESGLHRSAGAWKSSQYDPHIIEMRKRTFWTIFLFHVSLSGKLGRPIPLRAEDFDIEIPDPLPDAMPGENTSEWQSCSFRAAIEGFKLLKILLQVYSTIYAVRSPSKAYEMNVRQIEQQLQAFQAQIPSELSCGTETIGADRVSAIYLRLSLAECQLLLHHPSRQSDIQWENDYNLCLEACRVMLDCSTQLKEYNGFDTTWYYASNFLAAIFTTLFIWTQRADHMSSADVNTLKDDMNQWTEVMAVVGTLLGSGPRLQTAVRNVIDFSLGFIHDRTAQKTAVAAEAAIASTETSMVRASTGHDDVYNTPHGRPSNKSTGALPPSGTGSATQRRHYSADGPAHLERTAQYAPPSIFPYQEPSTQGIQTYSTGGNNGAFGTSVYEADETKPSVDSIQAQLNAHRPTPASQPDATHVEPGSQFMNTYTSAVQSQDGYQAGTIAAQHSEYPPGGWGVWNTFVSNATAHIPTNVPAQIPPLAGPSFMPPATTAYAHTGATSVNPGAIGPYGGPVMQMSAPNNQSLWPFSQVNTDTTEQQ